MNNSLLPEEGQTVTVRQRIYTVTEVRKSVIGRGKSIFHLITLTCIEDDALGETVQVIWENEVDAQVKDNSQLPTPKPQPQDFDTPKTLDTFLDAIRWGVVSQADRDMLQAPFRSGIRLEDYQLNPLVRAIKMPRVSLLIADDVGLGKTVETGLIIQEMMTRNRARTALIICPSGLQLHWQEQMRDKFGLEFRIIDSDFMRELRRNRGIHVNPWSHFPRLITSMDFIKRPRPLRLFQETVQDKPTYPRPFDILVVDEAHNVAPSGNGRYAIDSQRTQAIRTLVPYFEHHLFLSATPHNGYTESFTALLELLDNQRFARGVKPDTKQLELVMIRRLKRDIKDPFGNPRFPERKIQPLEVGYTDAERQVYGWLNEYTQLRRQQATSAEEEIASEFILKLLKKRLLSSPAAFHSTLETHLETLQKGSVASRSHTKSNTSDILKRRIEQLNDDYADDEAYEIDNQSAFIEATKIFQPPTPAQLTLIHQMIDWAKNASDMGDSKTRLLLEWLTHELKPQGFWNDTRIILFTEYRATQKWLQHMLASAGLAGDHLALIYGGMDKEKRTAIQKAFQAAPSSENKLRILIATDAASEGIDLQNYCHRLVHIEIPWNPNRMEQRNGRIDRMGQKHAPQIYHFAPAGYQRMADNHTPIHSVNDLEGDIEFLMRAVEKVEQIREDLMGKVGNVIAEQVEEAMLGIRRNLDLSVIGNTMSATKTQLKLDQQVNENIQKQIELYYKQRHDLRLTPEHAQKVVELGLEIAGQQPLQVASGKQKLFYVPTLTGAWSKAKEGLTHPFTQVERPIVFDESRIEGDSVVFVHLNHPLSLLAQRLLRAEIWSQKGKLNRVTARFVPNHALNEVAVVAYARLVIIGGGQYRLHEELITAGGFLTYGERPSFRRMTITALNEALDEAGDTLPNDTILANLPRYWESFAPSLASALENRVENRLETIYKQLESRRTTEMDNIRAILEELQRRIAGEMDVVPRQLNLFSPDENSQYQANVTALRHRLNRIPQEINDEQAVIHGRYSNFLARLFPVAISFLVPERLG